MTRRILVYGVTGAGKSTLARRVAARLGLPYHPVDDLTWRPGWVPVPEAAQRELIAAVCAGDAWVLDHAYGAWVDVILWWHVRSFARKRRRMRAWAADPAMPGVVLLRTPAEVEAWLAALPSRGGPRGAR